MIKTQEILVGTKSELLEYFSQSQIPDDLNLHSKGNILCTIEGFKKQLDEIIERNYGTGQVFYLETRTDLTNPETPEVNLSLVGTYIHVEKELTEEDKDNLINPSK